MMKIEEVKVGQLIKFPSDYWAKKAQNQHGINSVPDIGVVVRIVPDWQDDCDEEQVDVLWNEDNTVLPVDVCAIDLVSDVER